MRIEAKLEELGLVLSEPMQVPSGLQLPFSWVHVAGVLGPKKREPEIA
jgi:hypothetical protein